ncbi:MAG: hypothetical protein Q8K98_14485 [Bacteroidota bacterium]|nr:hypothetical protein [Bacteroidota bacterium]
MKPTLCALIHMVVNMPFDHQPAYRLVISSAPELTAENHTGDI